MTLISDIFDIPTQVHQGDFVLRLTEGVRASGRNPAHLRGHAAAGDLFRSGLAISSRAPSKPSSSKGAYLHGSFGSGKSHFMAVLTLLLQRNPEARAIPELASVVAKHNAWTEGRQFLVVPYHMIGAPASNRPCSAIMPTTSARAILRPRRRGSTRLNACSPMRVVCARPWAMRSFSPSSVATGGDSGWLG